MPNNTFGLPYPLGTDAADGPDAIKDLADAVGPYLPRAYANAAARDAAIPSPLAGMRVWLLDVNRPSEYNGTVWVTDQRTLAQATTSSAAFSTTEVVTDTLVAPVINGVRYKIVWDGAFLCATAADETVLYRIREDTVTGNILQGYRVSESVANASTAAHAEAIWTAGATASKTFVLSAVRSAGANTHVRFASPNGPSNFTIEPWQ